MPEVTIVVPVYNVEKYLRRCLNSILPQSFKDFQIILVNDGSTDNSPQLCEEFGKRDARVTVVHKENGGLTSARLAGYQEAEGRYIIFIDSDDYIHPEMIGKMHHSITENKAHIAICSYYLDTRRKIRPVYLPLRQSNIEKGEMLDKFILPIIGRIPRGQYINLPGFLWLRLFDKSILSKDCFVSEKEYFTEDDIFNLIVSQKVDRITIINEPLYYYFQNPDSLTCIYRKNMWRMLLKRYYFCRTFCRQLNISEKISDRLEFAYWSAITKSIDNVCRDGSFSAFKEELIHILNEKETNSILASIDKSLMTDSQKIIFYLLKYRMYKLLYRYRRMRMHLS